MAALRTGDSGRLGPLGETHRGAARMVFTWLEHLIATYVIDADGTSARRITHRKATCAASPPAVP
jgi:hypothetical protein